MIGPLPPPIGGVSVAFQVLVDLLKQNKNVTTDVIDFARIRNDKGETLSGFISLWKKIAKKIKQQDVIIISCSNDAIASLGLLLLLLCRILRKPLIIRKGAGLDYLAIGRLKGLIAHFVIKHIDLYLAETQYLVRLAQARGISHVKWFPNIRHLPENGSLKSSERSICRRFVFVGQVREHKGIREIIKAAERFDENIQIDIFGPFFDDLEQTIFNTCRRVRYLGILRPEEVISTMSQYDMMLLPSKHTQEGYPGAVIEAFLAGIPLITTRIGGIPEIVDEQTGIFVQAGDADGLYEEMKSIIENPGRYHRLVQGVLTKRREFSSTVWVDKFIEYCRQTAEKYQ